MVTISIFSWIRIFASIQSNSGSRNRWRFSTYGRMHLMRGIQRERERKVTFLPAILLERLPIQTGGNVHIFLTWELLLQFASWIVSSNEKEDADDKPLLSKLVPESQRSLNTFQQPSSQTNAKLREREMQRVLCRKKELGRLEKIPFENLWSTTPIALIVKDEPILFPALELRCRNPSD